jgi:hypothetical protein
VGLYPPSLPSLGSRSNASSHPFFIFEPARGYSPVPLCAPWGRNGALE